MFVSVLLNACLTSQPLQQNVFDLTPAAQECYNVYIVNRDAIQHAPRSDNLRPALSDTNGQNLRYNFAAFRLLVQTLCAVFNINSVKTRRLLDVIQIRGPRGNLQDTDALVDIRIAEMPAVQEPVDAFTNGRQGLFQDTRSYFSGMWSRSRISWMMRFRVARKHSSRSRNPSPGTSRLQWLRILCSSKMLLNLSMAHPDSGCGF